MRRPWTMEELIDRRTQKSGSCWLWTGYLDKDGYGRIDRGRGVLFAHRLFYEYYKGQISKGLQIDHTCHNKDTNCAGGVSCRHRRCVNPEHLDSVTYLENQSRSPHSFYTVHRRKTQCPHGHPYSDTNTYYCRDGSRMCRTCLAIRDKKRSRQKHKELV